MAINILFIVVAIALVLLNSFFVAAEFGMVKLRSTRVEVIKKTYGWRGKILAQVHKNLDAYLSACQLGITLASLGLGWVGEPAFAHLMRPLFISLGVKSPELIEVTAFFTAFAFISYLHIVVGELMPKSLAIRQSEIISVWTAAPLYAFYWAMYPAIWFLNHSSNLLLKLVGLNSTHKGDHFYSTDELKLIFGTSHLHGELTKAESKILEHTLDFIDLKVTDIMRPIEEMIALEIDQPIKKTLDTVIQYRYSRYPLYKKEKEHIIGILHVKDLFASLYQEKKISNLEPLLRPILKVPSHLRAITLLRRFREGMPHFAVVYSGKENPIGFVTLDNLLHVLLGRIQDEFHRTRDDWTENKDGSFTIKGNSSIYTLERALKIEIELPKEEDTEAVNTVAGLILLRTGRVPKKGELIQFDDFDVKIQKIKRGRIVEVCVYPKPKTKEEMR